MGILNSLKSRVYQATDVDAKAEAQDRQRKAKQIQLEAKNYQIAQERAKRAEIRSGKGGGLGTYIKSEFRQRQLSSEKARIESDLDPTIKERRKTDREIAGIERRQKWRSRFNKVDSALDQIGSFLPQEGGKGKGGNSFGLSEKDINELSGLGGSSRKTKSNGGISGFSQADINELAGLSSGRKSSTGRHKKTTHRKKTRRHSAPRARRSIFDIDI